MQKSKLLLVALLLLGSAPAAHAAGGAADDQARRHFERGQVHYNVGDFEAAIDEFKRAYEISPAPGLLFNIAQAYRAKRDFDRALYFYITYLREDPAAPEREYVEARMAEIRAARAAAPSAAQPPSPAPPPLAPPPRDDRGRGLRLGGLVTAASGAAFLGAAAVLAVRSGSASDEIEKAFAMHQPWSAHLAQVQSDGQRYQTAAWVMGAVGAAAVATGGVLYYLGARDRPVTVSAGVTGGGAAVTLRCAF